MSETQHETENELEFAYRQMSKSEQMVYDSYDSQGFVTIKEFEEDDKYADFKIRVDSTDRGKYYIQKPHGFEGCDGFGSFMSSYHLICSKCKLELKLWEFGVDYDVG